MANDKLRRLSCVARVKRRARHSTFVLCHAAGTRGQYFHSRRLFRVSRSNCETHQHTTNRVRQASLVCICVCVYVWPSVKCRRPLEAHKSRDTPHVISHCTCKEKNPFSGEPKISPRRSLVRTRASTFVTFGKHQNIAS